VLAGQFDEALALAQRVLAFARERGQRGMGAWSLRLLAEIASHRDPPTIAESEKSYAEALALAEELEMRPLAARCHLGLGRLYRKTGEPQKAQSELAAAVEEFSSMEITFWGEQADAALKAL
jgi:tetratricopeptide (TPR) repeat protein